MHDILQYEEKLIKTRLELNDLIEKYSNNKENIDKAIIENNSPPIVPIANENQNSSAFGPSIKNGTKPSTVENYHFVREQR